MIIDPKLETMFRQCRERKNRIDKRRKQIRAAMFCPPVLLAVFCSIHMILTILSGSMIFVLDGVQGTYSDIPCFILSAATAVFAAGEVMLENQALIKASRVFYPIAAVGYAFSFVVAFSVYRGSLFDFVGVVVVLGQLVMVACCVLSTVLSVFFKDLYDENERLKRLKGYPHFNPMFMSDAELRKEETSDRTPLEELTPDERLMRERDFNL